MRIWFSLVLPREVLSVPLTRRTLATSMRIIGVSEECVSDIEVALTEACTDVLDHADDHDHYEVRCYLDDTECVIDVVDQGSGFNSREVGFAEVDPDREAGRGIQLMRHMADRVRFESRPRGGTVVHLEKLLEWREGTPLREEGGVGG
jgi:serine/threonine-protein kinase RsbW